MVEMTRFSRSRVLVMPNSRIKFSYVRFVGFWARVRRDSCWSLSSCAAFKGGRSGVDLYKA